MGAVASSAVTLVRAWEEGDRNGKFQAVYRQLSVVLSTQGGATNTIGAVALGFRAGGLFSVNCVLFTDGGSQKRAVWCFTDGTNLYIGDPTNATDATRGIPGDVTGTLVVDCVGLN
tara:strand:+ start:2611 stop:2958 length:348 start_codon:yes stop_codon:yes gene_type:complete